MLNSAKTRYIQSEGPCITTVRVAASTQIDSDCMGGHAIETKPLRMAESRNWIKLLTTSLALCKCVCKKSETESRGLSGDGRHIGDPQLINFLYIKLSRLRKDMFCVCGAVYGEVSSLEHQIDYYCVLTITALLLTSVLYVS